MAQLASMYCSRINQMQNVSPLDQFPLFEHSKINLILMEERQPLDMAFPESNQASCPAALRWRGPLPPPFPPWSRCTASLAGQVHWATFLPGSWAIAAVEFKGFVQLIVLSAFRVKHAQLGPLTLQEACPGKKN